MERPTKAERVLRPARSKPARKFEPDDQRDRGTGKWENFEAPQDVCGTAYWYQVLPSQALPPIDPFSERIKDLGPKR